MAAVRGASGEKPVAGTDISNETVSLTNLSFFRSNLFVMTASAAVLLSSRWTIPLLADIAGVSISPKILMAAIGTLSLAHIILGLKLKKELMYEISLIYTIRGSKAWWNTITDKIVLGALPLEHQKDKIKALGVTHVLTTLEEFELRKGLVRPVSSKKWQGVNIAHKHIVAEDFVGMPADKIHEAVEYMRRELKANTANKFYVHCKAGRGRSVTVVVAYLWKYGYQTLDTKERAYAFVKRFRPQVNLNENQMAAIQAYIDKYPITS